MDTDVLVTATDTPFRYDHAPCRPTLYRCMHSDNDANGCGSGICMHIYIYIYIYILKNKFVIELPHHRKEANWTLAILTMSTMVDRYWYVSDSLATRRQSCKTTANLATVTMLRWYDETDTSFRYNQRHFRRHATVRVSLTRRSAWRMKR